MYRRGQSLKECCDFEYCQGKRKGKINKLRINSNKKKKKNRKKEIQFGEKEIYRPQEYFSILLNPTQANQKLMDQAETLS